MFIIRNKKIFFVISGVLVVFSLVSIFTFGLNLGVDFKGGSIVEVLYPDTRPSVDEIRAITGKLSFDNIRIQETNGKGYIIRTGSLEDSDHKDLFNALSGNGSVLI